MKEIPDFNIELSQAMDYIMGSDLAQKAFDNPPFMHYTNVLRALISSVDRLADNCHMAEFTNHALPHICSVVRRASEWGTSDGWLDTIISEEAGYLLLALVIHDIGMLSQDAQDLPQKDRLSNMKGFSDISNWVRRTHVIRLENLVKRLLKESGYDCDSDELHDPIQVVIGMAKSHQSWEWEDNFVSYQESIRAVGLKEENVAALNAVIAVCDLLDEDSNRCDTITLIKYKHGTMENTAHWIRHALTAEVDGVRNHVVRVRFRKLLPSSVEHEKIYRALRNHYRLVKLYNYRLQTINAQIDKIIFDPADGLPELADEVTNALQNIWVTLPEFKDYMVEQLLATFMPEALNLDNGDPKMRKRLDELGLQTIELSHENLFLAPETVYFSDERILFERKSFQSQLQYIKQQVDEAYLDRNIGKVRHLCYIAITDWKEPVPLQEVYWLLVYSIIFQKNKNEIYEIERLYHNELIRGETQKWECDNRLVVSGSYQPLLDVLFCLLDCCASEAWYAKYKEHLAKDSYGELVCDDATELLLETIVGMLWYYDSDGKSWKNVADALIQSIPGELHVKLSEYKAKLDVQIAIICHANTADLDKMRENSVDPMSRAWIDFWQEDWRKQEENIPAMSRIGNRDQDYMEAVQAYFNLVRQNIYLLKMVEKSREERENQKDKNLEFLNGEGNQKANTVVIQENEDVHTTWELDDQNEFGEREGKIGIFRLQRIVSEQRLSVFEEQRKAEMEQILLKCMRKPNQSQDARVRLFPLLALRTLDALRHWDLWQYIEAIRFQTRMEYLNGVYFDEDSEYCGDEGALVDCCIHYIQGLSKEALTEGERAKLVYCIIRYHREAINIIIEYIAQKSVPIQWPFAIEMIDSFAQYMSADQIKIVLAWLVKYDEAYNSGRWFYFNMGQYQFLKKWFDKIDAEDWKLVDALVEPIFQMQHNLMTNEKWIKDLWDYAPWALCFNYLNKLKEFPDNRRKCWQIYSAIIALSKRTDAKLENLRAFMCEVQNALDDKMKQCVDDSEFMEQAFAMKKSYDELQLLMEVENLRQLKPVDLAMIQDVLDELQHRTEAEGSLKIYNSEIINPVREAFINKNWTTDDTDGEKRIVDRIFQVLDRKDGIYPWYYRDFCDCLVAMENTGSDEICGYINQRVVKQLLKMDVEEDRGIGKDGPYQKAFFKVKTRNEYYIAVVLLLASGVTANIRENIPQIIEYTRMTLQTDEPILYNYAMVIFSYFYLNKKYDECVLLAGQGLQFIAGRLSAARYYPIQKREESIYECVKQAMKTMQESEKWFGENGFIEKVESDSGYKLMFEDMLSD